MEDQLTCPMCLEIFTDPCFVCANHHTLCRKCHKDLVSRSRGNDNRCPECRERLSRPVENSQMRSLIAAHRQHKICQGILVDERRVYLCRMPALNHCDHCNRSLCDIHLIYDHFSFQSECQDLLLLGEAAAEEAERTEALRASWSALIDDCIEQLQQRRKLDLEAEQPRAVSATLRSNICDLQDALKACDMRSAKEAFGRLKKSMKNVHIERTSGRPPVGAPPSYKEKSAMKLAMSGIVDSMELCYRKAAYPGPFAVLMHRVYFRVHAWAAAAGSFFGAFYRACSRIRSR